MSNEPWPLHPDNGQEHTDDFGDVWVFCGFRGLWVRK